MHAVATGAADPGLGMLGALKVRMRTRMAGEAGRIDCLWRSLGELQDLRFVPAGFHVLLPRSVAALAGKARAPMHKGHGGVRIVLQRFDLGAMAQCAGLVSGKATLRSVCLWGCRVYLLRWRRLGKRCDSASTHQE